MRANYSAWTGGLRVSTFDVFSQNKELLRSWLVHSNEGRKLLDSLLDDPEVNDPKDRIVSDRWQERAFERALEEHVATRDGRLVPIKTQCVVVLNGNGWVECYGPKHLRVEMVTLPQFAKSAKIEVLAQEYVEACLSLPAKSVYYPSNLIASERVSGLDVKEFHEQQEKRRAEQEAIKAINEFQAGLAREVAGLEAGAG